MRRDRAASDAGVVADWVARLVIAASIGIALAAIAHALFFREGLVGWNLLVWGIVGFLCGALSATVATAVAPSALTGLTIVVTYALLDGLGATPKDATLIRLASVGLLGAVAMAAAGVTGHGARLAVADLREHRKPRPTTSRPNS
jgi:hypothetical protein